MLRKFVIRTGLAALTWMCAHLAHAAPLFVNFDNFTYSGSVTRYATLEDARNDISPTGGPYTIPTATNGANSTRTDARDGQIYVGSEAPSYAADHTQVSTAWYFTTGGSNGVGNPNNTNLGFFQYRLYSSPTVSGGWQPGHAQFLLTVAGGDGDDGDVARLWPAPGGGAAALSGGKFVEFQLDVTAQFASPAVLNSTTLWYEADAMPSNVTGTLRGIFHNDQTSDTSYNGYYRFDFSVAGPGSWAADVGATWGANNVPRSFWAAPAAVAPPVTVALVPGPGKLALLA